MQKCPFKTIRVAFLNAGFKHRHYEVMLMSFPRLSPDPDNAGGFDLFDKRGGTVYLPDFYLA